MSTKLKREMAEDKQGLTRSERPVETFREGAIAAHVWKRQTSTGFEYLDFSLSRSWKLKSGEKEGYSSNFFEQNQEALFAVIARASNFIRAHSAAEARTTEREESAAKGVVATKHVKAQAANGSAEGSAVVG